MKDVKKNSSSGIPLIIIVLVLVGVVVGGWYLYSSAKQRPKGNTNGNVASTNTTRPPVNAPIGANPPNMLGSPTAAVTVEEFADFQCGSCAAVHPVMKEIQSIYGSKIKLVFRNFPLQMHDKAYDAAVVAEAAGIQGKFWQMQDQLFQNQQSWASPSANHRQLWNEYAQKIGLDVQQFQNDVSGMAAKSRVDQDLGRGRVLGVGSTPTIYVNGEPVPFQMANVSGLRGIIDQKLQEAAATQTQTARPQTAPANTANSNAIANGK
jgi:protein-disulfide isomerase